MPTTQVNEPAVQGGDRPFPEGVYIGTIAEPTTGIRQRIAPDFFSEGENPQIVGQDGDLLGVWLTDNQRLDEGDDPGQQIYFLDLIVRDGDTEIEALDLENPNGVGWGITRDARYFVQLAHALGAVTEEDGYVVPAPSFRTLLQQGTFDGARVQYEVRHRVSKKNGKSYPFVKQISAVE
jgi:hypothetical protein